MGGSAPTGSATLAPDLRDREMVLREYFWALWRGEQDMASLIERASAQRKPDPRGLTLLLPLKPGRRA